jgi:hypothetical protein
MGKLIALLLALTSAAFAQWAAFPSKKVPMKDGKVDLAAATPRTAWDTPDFSGLWENVRGAKREGEPPYSEGPPVATFQNVGAAFKDGLPLQPWAAELLAKRKADHSKDNPDARCLPMGLMQFHEHSQPRKIVQTPDLITIIYEANSGLRQIFLDGRKLPGPEADAWWYGYSVGRWEGDTLVVETNRMKDLQWLDINGSPLTEDGKLIERFRRTHYGTMEIEVTVEDPKAYTSPWTVRFNQRIMPNAELIEFICAENDKFTSYLEGARQK